MKETLKVEGMTCSCCAGKVEKSVNQLGGVSSIEINVDNDEIQLDFDKDAVSMEQIKEKIEAEGYRVI